MNCIRKVVKANKTVQKEDVSSVPLATIQNSDGAPANKKDFNLLLHNIDVFDHRC
jgi:hypothetical protein